jgi:hypothetical protein
MDQLEFLRHVTGILHGCSLLPPRQLHVDANPGVFNHGWARMNADGKGDFALSAYIRVIRGQTLFFDSEHAIALLLPQVRHRIYGFGRRFWDNIQQ